MMGVGNITELTDADTSGINALLFGIASELGVAAVLTTRSAAMPPPRCARPTGHAASCTPRAKRAPLPQGLRTTR
jgi:dihydropteroate synthase